MAVSVGIIGAVARGPHGTFVASNDGWLVWYEKQQFFRSSDGVHWDVLDKSKFKGIERFGKPQKGHILVQDHGDRVWYRSIRIKAAAPTAASR